MTTSIRPVTGRWPSSSSLWQDTSLPLACVLIPSEGSSCNATSKLAEVAKCLHCGAPQVSTTTHYRMPTSLLCYLCGKVSSTRYRDQHNGRPREHLTKSDYRGDGRHGEQSDDCILALPLYDDVYQVPAMACPPVWWIVVDGTIDSRSYWNMLGTSLRNVCKDMPPHVHVGLLMATGDSLAVWDLSSAVPHVKHVPWEYTVSSQLNLPLTPATSNLQAALRALGDTTDGAKTKKGRMPLGPTIQLVLETMERASHPGAAASTKTKKPTYAGGRILVLLGGPPAEVKCRPHHRHTHYDDDLPERGTGGHGGSCAPIGRRYVNAALTSSMSNDVELGSVPAAQNATLPESDDTDMTATNLSKLYASSPERYLAELGQQCADAGLGVDVLVVQYSNEPTNVGLPFLRHLSDRSGAPGPLNCDEQNLETELTSRTPWHSSIVFGGILRVRSSAGFSVDSSAVEGSGDDGPQLAPFYASGGLMGPASLQEDGLWRMGCCEETTAVTVDFSVHRHVKDVAYVDGVGNVRLKHALQTCFAYTAIEQEPDGSFVTVRRMKVASLPLPLANDTESLFATLDPEALAVVLFHKLTIASLQDGLVQTHEIGQQWLQSLMACAYRSAEEEEAIQQEQLSRGLETMNPVFYPQERLLNRNGELSAEEVLLGQGHERLYAVPLIVFALLQCDALRSGGFQPTIDSRCAASAQMYSMSPNILARCFAPRLDLWASGDDDDAKEPIMEHMDLSREQVTLSLMEQSDGQDNLIVFLDSPREIVVMNGSHLLPDNSSGSKVVIGQALEHNIQAAKESYRVPPPVIYELTYQKDQKSSFSPTSRLADALVEDSETVQGLQNFLQWKQEVAAMVQEQVDK